MSTMGERIKQVRKQAGMTQTEFAREIGVSTTTICQLETGTYQISRGTKKNLCDRFYVNSVWLESGEGEMYYSSADSVIAGLTKVFSKNEALMKTVQLALRKFTEDDWKKINLFLESLMDLKS